MLIPSKNVPKEAIAQLWTTENLDYLQLKYNAIMLTMPIK